MSESVKNELLKEMTRERTVYGDSYENTYRNMRRRGSYRGAESKPYREYRSQSAESKPYREYQSRGAESKPYREYQSRGTESKSYRDYQSRGAESKPYREYQSRDAESKRYQEYQNRGESRKNRNFANADRTVSDESSELRNSLLSIVLVLFLTITIPYLITTIMSGKSYRMSEKMKDIHSGREIIVKQNGKNTIIDVEQYIAAVLAAETDMNVTDEVLRANAVMLRTEIYYKMGERDIIEASEFPHTYYFDNDLKKLWGKQDYQTNITRIEEAVLKTFGQTE